MSVQSELNRISGNIADTYDELENLGATMPVVENSANLASTVQTVSVVRDVTLNGTSVVSNKVAELVTVDNVTSAGNLNALTANQGKILNDRIDSLAALGRFLSGWNCTTGLPTTEPSTLPYTYKSGDYYRITLVGTINYMPEGGLYTGDASTTTTSLDVLVGDFWFYDGSIWTLLINHVGGTVTDVKVDGTTVVSGGVASIDLTGKQDKLPATTSHFGEFLHANSSTGALEWSEVDVSGKEDKSNKSNAYQYTWEKWNCISTYIQAQESLPGTIWEHNIFNYGGSSDVYTVEFNTSSTITFDSSTGLYHTEDSSRECKLIASIKGGYRSKQGQAIGGTLSARSNYDFEEYVISSGRPWWDDWQLWCNGTRYYSTVTYEKGAALQGIITSNTNDYPANGRYTDGYWYVLIAGELTYASTKALVDGLSTKQDTLVSGTNIKTLNNSSILGSGNLDIQGVKVQPTAPENPNTGDVWIDTSTTGTSAIDVDAKISEHNLSASAHPGINRVSANPTVASSAPALTSLTVGSTDYKIEGGSGSGVYIGDTPPTDPEINAWVDTSVTAATPGELEAIVNAHNTDTTAHPSMLTSIASLINRASIVHTNVYNTNTVSITMPSSEEWPGYVWLLELRDWGSSNTWGAIGLAPSSKGASTGTWGNCTILASKNVTGLSAAVSGDLPGTLTLTWTTDVSYIGLTVIKI